MKLVILFQICSIFFILLHQTLSKRNSKKTATISKNKPNEKFRKATLAIMSLKNNHKYMKQLKEKPSFLKRIYNLIIKTFYNPEDKQKYEESMRKKTVEAIENKIKYYDEVMNKFKEAKISDLNKLKISYYIGIQRREFFNSYKDTVIFNSIKTFIEKKSKDIQTETKEYYNNFLLKMISINSDKTYNILSLFDKIQLKLNLDYLQSFQENFELNDLALFSNEGMNLNFRGKPKTLLKSTNEDMEKQMLIDAIKKNLQMTNIKTSSVYAKCNEISESIKNNELVVYLNNMIKEVKQNVKDKEQVKDLVSNMVKNLYKLEKGEASISEIYTLISEVKTALQYLPKAEFKFDDLIVLGKAIEEIKSHIVEMRAATTNTKFLAELLISNGNIVTLSPIQLHKNIGEAIILAGQELILFDKVIKDIDVSLTNRVEFIYKEAQADTLTFNTQLFSDFALDSFVYKGYEDSVKKIEDKGKEVIVPTLVGILNEMNDARDKNTIDKYSSVGNDFDIGDSSFGSESSVYDSINKSIENYINNESSLNQNKSSDDENMAKLISHTNDVFEPFK